MSGGAGGIGIDVGSTYTKYCVLAGGEPLELFCEETPVRQREHFSKRLRDIREEHGGLPAVSCGYGRGNVGGARAVSEIAALAAGAGAVDPGIGAIIDVGGQDTKRVTIRSGRVASFFVNDRCAAGCGIFLRNTLTALGVPFGEVDLTGAALPRVRLSSTCAVFAQSEIVGLIAAGEDEGEIVRAVIAQILAQARALVEREDCDSIALSGGLARIPGIGRYAEMAFGIPVAVPRHAQYLSAIGCAVMARGDCDEGSRGL